MPLKPVKELLASEKYSKIHEDLLDQLDRNGTVGEYYVDLIHDYMDMWVTKCLLIQDIQRRGVHVPYNNGGGQKGRRKNDSVTDLIKVNAQMLKLLSELGIDPTKLVGDLDDEEM